MPTVERTYDNRTFEISARVRLGAPSLSYYEPDDPSEVDAYEVEEVAGADGVVIEWEAFVALLERLFGVEGAADEITALDEALVAVAYDDASAGGAHD